ncbi:MAG: tyrosine-type recombinase/integrase [Bacteroidota bacterium]
MATVTPFIRTSRKKNEDVNIRFRLYDGRKIQLFHKSEITVNPDYWDEKRHEIKAKIVAPIIEKNKFKNEISARTNLLLEIYEKVIDKNAFSSSLLEIEVEKRLNPEKHNLITFKDKTFFEIFEDFIQKHNVSEIRKRDFKVAKKMLERFEIFQQCELNKRYVISFENFTSDTLFQLDYFLKNEYRIYKKYPVIYSTIKKRYSIQETSSSIITRSVQNPKMRGQNTLSSTYSKIRAFIYWSIKQGYTKNNPFDKFTVPSEVYGTPYYITIEERNKLYSHDLSARPQLSIQRDIFIFQCVIGCRVGDLIKMKKADIINDAIQYVAHKTKGKDPITIRVPLNSIAKEILHRYKDIEGNFLLPFISEQKYNNAIKAAFKEAELTRNVTVLNPTSGLEEKKPLNEVASSHLARRCFIGNLYKQVQDPNLIGKLSGHSENSRAFARYRDIDEDMKIGLVKLLE